MLFVWQLPFSDARLLSATGARLQAPDWPTPRMNSDFVRGFGPVLRRRRGGHEEFVDERVYAAADHALRFQDLTQQSIKIGDRSLTLAVPFRRLLCSDRQLGGVCARVEVGLETRIGNAGGARATARRTRVDRPRPPGRGTAGQNPGSAGQRPDRFDPVELRSSAGKGVSRRDLAHRHTGRALRAPFRDRRRAPRADRGHLPTEQAGLPQGVRAIAPERVGGLDLHFIWIEYRRREFGLWFLRRDPGQDNLSRRLRVGLLRLHAEHQALRAVLTSLLRGDLQFVRGSREADLLDAYLRNAVRILGRDQHGGFSHSALQEVIAAYQSVVNAEELTLLESRLEAARRQVGSRVIVYTQAAAEPPQAAALPPPAVEKGDAIRVFVSYSHRDGKYVRPGALVDYLTGGLKDDRFDFWYDTALRGGDDWDERIRTELDRADIALVLVSQWFLNSAYIRNVELATFLEGKRSRGLHVYPVILRKCDWKTQAWLAATQFQPRDGKTVEDNYRTQAAREGMYLTILQELREIGSDLRKSRTAAPPVLLDSPAS